MDIPRGLAGRLSGPDRAALARILDALAASVGYGRLEVIIAEGVVADVALTARARRRGTAKTLAAIDDLCGPLVA